MTVSFWIELGDAVSTPPPRDVPCIRGQCFEILERVGQTTRFSTGPLNRH
jgi:hypothetical protein